MSDMALSHLSTRLDWCATSLERCVCAYLEGAEPPALCPTQPVHPEWPEEAVEQAVISLALLGALAPEKLDLLTIPNPAFGRPYTVFGVAQNSDGSACPTVQTAAFLISGHGDLQSRLEALRLTSAKGRLVKEGWIVLSDGDGLNRLAARLMPGPALTDLFHAKDGRTLPGAHSLTTSLTPADLVVPETVRTGLDDLKRWLAYGETVFRDWNLSRLASPGYRALFHGPPGTGKTLAAALLGKETDRQVFRIDLSQMTSKWIGETEKNLAAIFDAAADLDAILFFDEADALFGKRTETRSSNDRYANQEVSYLLQRIEQVRGLTVLASNLKSNIDMAFQRRFQRVIYFPMPGAVERLSIWTSYLSEVPQVEPLDMDRLADVEATGATIANSIMAAALAARAEGLEGLTMRTLENALRRERQKQGQGAST